MQARHREKNHLLAAAAVSLLLGAVYYLYFRIFNTGTIADPSAGSFPALVHMLVLTWMAFALTGVRRGLCIAISLLGLSIAAEWHIGYPDKLDTIMLLAGFCIASTTSALHLRTVPDKQSTASTTLAASGLLLCSTVFITGTGGGCMFSLYGCNNETRPYFDARPVYMDYQTLRSSVRVSDPRPLKDISRIYVYQNAVFLNSLNQGLHVLDNTDPGNPRNVAFIEIPGNTEVSIRNNYLYVDSYVDLVTLSISDPLNPSEVDRDQEIFAYDAYQNVPDDIFFGLVDESRGVVVSYESTD